MRIAAFYRPIFLAALLSGCHLSVRTSSETGNGPEHVARAFLERIVSDGAAGTYPTAAAQMRAAVDPNAFHAMVMAFGLDKFQSIDFTDSTLASDGTMLLGGTLHEKGALGIPAKVRVIANTGGWEVVSLEIGATSMTRVGEAAHEPGIAMGTRTVAADKLGSICRAALALSRDPMCAHSLPFANGASSECFGVRGSRAVAIVATLADVDTATGNMNVTCHITD